MSRGRKVKSFTSNNDEQNLFYEYVGSYFQTIISNLGCSNSLISNESSSQLLKEIRSISKISLPEIDINDINVMPFKIPKNWIWCRLGEVIKLTDNLNIHSQFNSNTIINYVDIDAIDNKKYVIREVKQRSVSELSSRARRVLKKGYLVYSLVRPYLNNIAIIEEEKQNFIGSTGFAVFTGIKIENEFIKYYLLSDFIRKRYLEMLSGFNSPSITYEQFASTPFPLAPLQEQRKITCFLKDFEFSNLKDNFYFNYSVENKIRNLDYGVRKGIELKNEFTNQSNYVIRLRQSFLLEAMQGKLVKQDPKDGHAKNLLEKIKAEKAKLGKKEKVLLPIKTEEIPFEIPANWVWCRLGDVISYTDNLDIQKTLSAQTLINYVDIDSIDNNKFIIKDIKQKKVSELSTRARRVLRKGYIMYSTVRPYLRNIAIVENELPNFIGSTGFNVFREVETNLKYIFYFLLSPTVNEKYKELMVGFNSPSITIEQFEKTLFPLPPISEQDRIVNKLSKLMKRCDELESSIQKTQDKDDLLLQQILKESLFEI